MTNPAEPPRFASGRALAATLALACACGLHSIRFARSEPTPGAVAFDLGGASPARCRVELERVPPAIFALGVFALAREGGLAGGMRAVGVEVERDRPLLTIRLSAPGAEGAPRGKWSSERFCADLRALAAEVDAAKSPDLEFLQAARWPLEIGDGQVHFRSVQRVSRGGEPGGFVEYWIASRPDGTRVLGARGALFSRQGEQWRPLDSVQVEETDARGMLRRGRYVRTSGGLEQRIEVRSTGDGKFAYSGLAKGKEIAGSFEARGGLATGLFRVELFRERAGAPPGPAEPLRVDTYQPGLDPTRPTPTVFRRDPTRTRGFVQQVGQREATGVVDRNGSLEWLEQAGDPPVRYETISLSGVP